MLRRYEFFKLYVDVEGWDEQYMNFPLHAIMLLGEIRAEESLKKVLEVLQQEFDFLDFWFGDHLFETLWEPLYHIGQNQLARLRKFVIDPDMDTMAVSLIASAVSQIHFHHPERKDEVEKWYSDVLEFFVKCPPDDKLFDSETIALIIVQTIDIGYKNLLPLIRELFRKKYVLEEVTGDFKEVERYFNHPPKSPQKKDLLNISDRYENILSTWASYKEDDDEPEMDFDYTAVSETMPLKTGPKIGRNDPCPCGSGKKYKKCCMNKKESK